MICFSRENLVDELAKMKGSTQYERASTSRHDEGRNYIIVGVNHTFGKILKSNMDKRA